ncbi:NADH:ubiquinone oxidoreductase subunit [Novosphingobium sp. SG751A]|uniref:NADH:ubiquinone oxidoreductase subunit NDUFA12 n=1 Tax=unclassified Novosphingobium TaxID=2644732 RepID=UPI00086EEFD7|nr:MULTISPECIES: NADH:ubiquinone oxidoreductase subunit NDUFA12 [unclassified Novosphingobium]MBN9143012.1 NADH:ubiquinone oxidoreductase subunit NDUFA12 [Novosphingobium sp.]MDR6706097.1 NADH:ubiquinone oxidoreductase subunit [Novosphingobium sp. 1748]NKJ02552.1 NADH:ubiquinone oxidoreductase subunit [Novosphingobium sp. SG707]NOW46227.1 NADH:ubiquinone oxidoreductase subunit [Novosphingobium sp. SG751A]ODU84851.1 MAG: NADH dehydrogenase [Novosphingobium sp. SCN 63-17]
MLFTWWNGSTFGTWLNTKFGGEQVGTDFQGNKYYRSKKVVPAGTNSPFAGMERRWVIYNGANDSSRVPAEWHGWLHHSYDAVPQSHLPPPRIWETEYTPNATGTAKAHQPHPELRGAGKAKAAGYEAWTPEG